MYTFLLPHIPRQHLLEMALVPMACWRQGRKGRGSWVTTHLAEREDVRNLCIMELGTLNFELDFFLVSLCHSVPEDATTNVPKVPNLRVHLPEIRRKAGLG